MASNQVVKNRMKSVKSIQKITKAMKMVAASKLRGVQQRAEDSRAIWQPFNALLGDVTDADVENNIVLTVSTDRGLCGGINSTSVKYSRALTRIMMADGNKTSKYVVLGEKGKAQLQRDSKQSIGLTITETTKNPVNFTQVASIVDDILKRQPFDACRIVFNRFNSVVSFGPTCVTILSSEALQKVQKEGGPLDTYEFEGVDSSAELLQDLTELQMAAVLYNALLENSCSEQGARMSAMDNSSRNATDMLERLTLSYNRSRQASITTELIEIISGATALEG
eukprot:TRINITY_DN1292_c0_g1_i6.p1 TRINITY_DN1292_c0_g1~~TRINITY_DN1292_c0_g1_i6.p1  ORF type:complete len:281 (-),score=53.78 TRINITY_DN1292_c0_g1_i6:284-1126(-)